MRRTFQSRTHVHKFSVKIRSNQYVLWIETFRLPHASRFLAEGTQGTWQPSTPPHTICVVHHSIGQSFSIFNETNSYKPISNTWNRRRYFANYRIRTAALDYNWVARYTRGVMSKLLTTQHRNNALMFHLNISNLLVLCAYFAFGP